MTPDVTIGVPAYDNAATIGRTVRSIRSQTYENWYAIISVDGSDEGTAAVAQSAIDGDPRFEVIRQETRLGALNFRVPLERAMTPLFVWLAGDDHWHPEFLARLTAHLSAHSDAVGVLSQCLFERDGRPTGERPETGTLSGSWSARVCGFLAAPNGTRMYAVFRTAPLRASFPNRAMDAYDWALMIAVLRHGDLIEFPEPLLVRDRTPWESYAKKAAAEARTPLRKRHPMAELATYLLVRGRFPWSLSAVAALRRLDRAKREEIAFVTDPARFLASRREFAAAGLRFASTPSHLTDAAQRALEAGRSPDLALRVLEYLSRQGEVPAQRALGAALAAQGNDQAAWSALRAAAATGDATAQFNLIEFERDAGLADVTTLAARYLAVAEAGALSAAARAGDLLVRGAATAIDPWRLHALLKEARAGGIASARYPLAWMTERGLGCQADLLRARALYAEASGTNAAAHRDLAKLSLAYGQHSAAARHYEAAVAAGMAWCAVDLLELSAEHPCAAADGALDCAVGVLAFTGDPKLRDRLSWSLRSVQEFKWLQLARQHLDLRGASDAQTRDLLIQLGHLRPGCAADGATLAAVIRDHAALSDVVY